MRKRILLAEDEPNIIESLTFILERAGFEVAHEVDGPSALEAIMAGPPDVVVLDVMLPGLDGMEILRQIRASATTQTLPVLMLTAKGQHEDRATAIHNGANLFIAKPFANQEVIDAVRQLAGAPNE